MRSILLVLLSATPLLVLGLQGEHAARHPLLAPRKDKGNGADSKKGDTGRDSKSKDKSPTFPSPSASPSPSSTPLPTEPCLYGPAFGYKEEDSVTLDTQNGTGCSRWGCYETPTLAELQSGISGPLYVGVAGNDIDRAVKVGIWTAVAYVEGGIAVAYIMDAPYLVDEVNIDLACLPIASCAPDQYLYRYSGPTNVFTVGNLQYPTCSGGSQAYLIVQAVVYKLTVPPCPAPVAQ